MPDSSQLTKYGPTANAVHIPAASASPQNLHKEADISQGESFWNAHFQDLFPQGHGRYLVQAHFRGLSDEERAWSIERLLLTDHPMHFDMRLEAGGHLIGWTIFAGTTKDNRDGLRIFSGNPLQVTPKLPHNTDWLTDKDEIIQESGTYSKLCLVDSGTYDLGVVRLHFAELFLSGKLKGRYLFQYARVAEDKALWLFTHPQDQTPYADSHNRSTIISELQGKKQSWLIWSKPGQSPEKVDTSKVDVVVKSADPTRHLIYGVVLRPNNIDTQGDFATPEDIERAAHRFMIRSQRYDFMHRETLSKGRVYVVESYIAPADFEINGHKVYKGSWVVVSYVPDNDLWQKILSGKINAYSIRGWGKRKHMIYRG
jgi:hypothetical protein